MSFYIHKNGIQTGPFTEAQVKEGLRIGSYLPDDLCWKEGWDVWKKLGSVYSEKDFVDQKIASGNSKTVSDFEKNIFGFTRWFVGSIAAAVILFIAILLLVVIFPIGNINVSYSEITTKNIDSGGLNPVNSIISIYTGGNSEPETKIRIPKNVREKFEGENAEVLDRWIDACPASQRQDFVDNLSHLISKATDEGLSSSQLTNLVNDYNEIKKQKIMEAEMTKFIALWVKSGAVLLIVLMILVLCLVSLILVILAIERNTRTTS